MDQSLNSNFCKSPSNPRGYRKLIPAGSSFPLIISRSRTFPVTTPTLFPILPDCRPRTPSRGLAPLLDGLWCCSLVRFCFFLVPAGSALYRFIAKAIRRKPSPTQARGVEVANSMFQFLVCRIFPGHNQRFPTPVVDARSEPQPSHLIATEMADDICQTSLSTRRA